MNITATFRQRVTAKSIKHPTLHVGGRGFESWYARFKIGKRKIKNIGSQMGQTKK